MNTRKIEARTIAAAAAAEGKKYISEHFGEFSAYEQWRFEQGDRAAIFDTLQWCFILDKPVPRWAVVAFIDGWWDAKDQNSLDAAFGRPRGKGKHARRRKTHEKRLEAYIRIRELHDGEGVAIDPELFDRVGRGFGMSKTKCSEIYYELHKQYQLLCAETGTDHFHQIIKFSGNTGKA